MIRYLVFSLLACVAYMNAGAQQISTASLDKFFDLVEAKNKGMGSIAIYSHGEPVYERSIGYSDVERSTEATAATRYGVGAISKTFTATLIYKLIQDGELTESTLLSEFYPDIKNAEKITIATLLRHKSGIANITDEPTYEHYMLDPATKEKMIERIVALESDFEPMVKYVPSNTNYILLTFIAEEVTGLSFDELLRQYITEPLGMDSTDVGKRKHSTKCYMPDGEGAWTPMPQTHYSITVGSGSIVSTPSDLCKFFTALFNEEILDGEYLNKMTTLEGGVGVGLIEMPFYDLKGYGETGGIDGFQAVAAFFPEDSLSIAYTANGTDYPLNNIMVAALSIYYKKPFRLPEFPPPVKITERDLKPFLGVYSNASFPMKITITAEETQLYVQATGQKAYPLEPYAKNRFRFDSVNLEVEFLPGGNELMLRQNEYEFQLQKEKSEE